MKDIFKTNWFLILISVLSAILIWVYVVYEINPMYEMTIRKLPVEYLNQSSDFDTGKLTVLSANSETVDLKVKGKRSVLSKVKTSDIRCTINMGDVKSSGTYSFPLNISFNVDGVEVVSKNPYNISLNIDKVVTEEKEIKIETVGKPADGYIAESVEYTPLKIRLTGAKSIVSKVKTAAIKVDLTGAADTISGRYKVKLYDSEGNEYDNESISKNITYTELKYNIFQSGSISVNPVLSDEINRYGEKLTVSKIKPSKLTVIGDKRVMLKLDKLDTEEINVSGIRNGDTVKVKISELPENSYFDGETDEVEITFSTEE